MGENTPLMVTYSAIGKRTKRYDSPPKLTGQERFTADLRLPGLLKARIVGSAYAHARIRSVEKTAAQNVPGVRAVLTAEDLPLPTDENGHPASNLLAGEEALHVGHPVALVLAETDLAAQDAADLVQIDYEPLAVVTTLDQAIDPEAPRVRHSESGGSEEEAAMHNADATQSSGEEEDLPPNVSNSINFERGDIDAGFAAADEIVELTLESLTVHQGYIEPQVALAVPDALQGMTVYTSTQAAFHGRGKVAETLGLPLDRVTIVPMPVGGGFGGKFVLIEPLVAAAAKAVDAPVLLQYTRTDDFLAGNPAPDCRIRLKVGAKQSGELTALDSDMLFDAGAAAGSPLNIAAVLMGGYYRVPNLRIKGYEAQTHKPSAGSYRAPGAQQGTFAIESVMDELAGRLGMDPLELRLLNCVQEGDPRPNGNAWPKIGLRETLEALRQHPVWQSRGERRANGKGIGIAVGGWPGGLEPATAACRLDEDGKMTVVLGSVDLNGTNTTFAQITAEAFGVDSADVRVKTADTSAAPYAGGTGGSKITYTVGPAVARAAADAAQQIKNIAAQHLEVAADDLEVSEGQVRVKGVPSAAVSLKEIAKMSMTVAGKYEPVYGKGSSAITKSAPGFAVHLAEVEVDEVTGEVHVTNYVAAQDVGFAINPAAVEGQIHGGVAQGIGWALYEGIEYDDDGQPSAASLMDYALPKATMIPEIDVVLVQITAEDGPYGAKGVGEPPAIPGPAAVANAIADAIGARCTRIPIRPADILASMNA